MALRVERLVPALRDLCEALAELGVDWAVARAIAANNYRDETRTTTVLDVLLALAGSGMAEVEAALHRRGWTTTALVPEGWLLRVQHLRGGRIDVVTSLTDYEARALAKAHSATVDDLRFKTMPVEDVVILKLVRLAARARLGIRAVQERCPPVFVCNPSVNIRHAQGFERVSEYEPFKSAAHRCSYATQVSTFGMLKDSSASRNTSRSRALPTGVRMQPKCHIRHAQGFERVSE